MDIPEARTLLQCCEPEDQLRKHASECEAYIHSLHDKVSAVPTVLAKLEREVEKIISGASVDEVSNKSLEDRADTMPPNTVQTAKGAVWVSSSLSGEGSLPQWLAALLACSKHSAPNLGRLQEIVAEMESHHEDLQALLREDEATRSVTGGGDDDSPLSGSMSVHFTEFDERHKLHERELLPELKLLAEAVSDPLKATFETTFGALFAHVLG